MKQKMNLNAVRRILFVFYAMLLSLTAAAQNLNGILGTVTDENGDPVIGATVVERLPLIPDWLYLMWVMSPEK